MDSSTKDCDTEVNVFRVLANSSKINSEPRPPTSSAQPVSVPAPIAQPLSAQPTVAPPGNPTTAPAAALPPGKPVQAQLPHASLQSLNQRESLFKAAVKEHTQSNAPKQQPAPTPARPVEPAPVRPPAKPAEEPDVLLEKQATLMEIEQLKTQGATISRNFSMSDSLQSMQFEVRKHLQTNNETRTMHMMSDGMRLMFTGLEMANSKLGPVMDLDGWAAEITTDMSRFDPALRRLYRKYYRRSQLSAEYELMFAILSSMVMFHFSKKIYGGATQQPSGPTMPDPSMFANMFGGDKSSSKPSQAPPPRNSQTFSGAEAPPPSFD